MWTDDEVSRERLHDLSAQMIDVQTDLRELRARVGDVESLPLPERVARERPDGFDYVTVSALGLIQLSLIVQLVVLVGLIWGWWGR